MTAPPGTRGQELSGLAVALDGALLLPGDAGFDGEIAASNLASTNSRTPGG